MQKYNIMTNEVLIQGLPHVGRVNTFVLFLQLLMYIIEQRYKTVSCTHTSICTYFSTLTDHPLRPAPIQN
jgi:hypothetical protein